MRWTLVSLGLALLVGWAAPGGADAGSADDDPSAGMLSAKASSSRDTPSTDVQAWGRPSAISTSAIVEWMIRDRRQHGEGTRPEASALPPEKTRGGVNWSKVYRDAAPSVVFLAADNGYGSGFLIDDGGWLVTNHHVASLGRLTDERHWRLDVFTGDLDPRGMMNPRDKPATAFVYAWDDDRDLALLRLEDSDALGNVSGLRLGDTSSSSPGNEVALIGNAGLGLLWSMKPGHVSAVGTMASNRPDFLSAIAHELGLGGPDLNRERRELLEHRFGQAFAEWIGAETLLIESTAGSASGDSGGPLLDRDGRIAGICMGGLSKVDADERGVIRGVSKRHFYVHHEEIASFVERRPSEPMLEIARDPWHRQPVAYAVRDSADRGKPDTLVGFDILGNAMMVAVDLDGDPGIAPALLDIDVPILGVHATRDGLVTVYTDGTIVGSGPERSIRWHHPGTVPPSTSAVSPDGEHVAIGFLSGDLVVLDSKTGAAPGPVITESGAVSAIAFEPGADAVWVARQSGTGASVGRVPFAGDERQERLRFDRRIVSLDVSPDGASLVVAESEGPTHQYRTADGSLVWTNPEAEAYRVRFSPDGESLVASPMAPIPAMFWLSVEDGSIERTAQLSGSPWLLQFSPDGGRICAQLHEDSRYLLYDVAGERVIGSWEMTSDAEYLEALMSSIEGMGLPTMSGFAYTDSGIVTGDVTGSHYVLSSEDLDAQSKFALQVEGIDALAAGEDRQFDAEFAWIMDHDTTTAYAIYDLDGDGVFERVRLDADGDLETDSEFARSGARYRRRTDGVTGSVFLPASEVPEPGRESYRRVVAIATGQ